MKQRQPKAVPDAARPGMWRVQWPDGRLSDMTNLTRAKDAVTFFIETEEREFAPGSYTAGALNALLSAQRLVRELASGCHRD